MCDLPAFTFRDYRHAPLCAQLVGFLFVYLFCFVFWRYGALNSGFVFVRQVLYHFSHTSSPMPSFWFFIYFKGVVWTQLKVYGIFSPAVL
jgi:hypothetical protein